MSRFVALSEHGGSPEPDGEYLAYCVEGHTVKRILKRSDGQWFYCGLDRAYRGLVEYCIGPLPNR